MKDATPWSGLMQTAALAVYVHEYSDGTNSSQLLVFDPASRRYIHQHIADVEQPAKDPFSLEELLLMAALEVYARRVDPQLELPW